MISEVSRYNYFLSIPFDNMQIQEPPDRGEIVTLLGF